jgi:hypothetical protein
MYTFMSKGAEFRETGRLPGENEMSNKTSVVSPAEGPPTHGYMDKLAEEELANPESTITCNPNIAEAREMVIKYINESEEMKNSGDGMRAIRRHGGTILVVYGVQRRDFSRKSDFCWLRREFLCRIWHTLKGADSLPPNTTTRTIGNHPAVA